MKAIYAGSFDPITYGHLDIVKRASEIFDELVIVIMDNDEKNGLFSNEERKDLVENCISEFDNVTVSIGTGLTVDYARSIGANILVRGIRAVTDYEYEMMLATTNMKLAEDIHTVFLVAKPEYSFLSSSTAKTIMRYDGDVSSFVPEYVEKKLREKFNDNQF